MTKREQKKFVNELCKHIAKEINKKIDEDKIPDNWDGWELRKYVADSSNFFHMSKKRMRDYKNTLIVNGL
jgi:hypothetical protein